MSATAKIDFPPGLFDEAVLEKKELDRSLTRSKANSARIGIIIGFAIVTILLILAALALGAWRSTPRPLFPSEAAETPTAVLAPSISDTSIVSRAPQEISGGFCDGHELICATTTTDKPAEMLQKLAAALPQGAAKHYQVRLSVTSANDE